MTKQLLSQSASRIRKAARDVVRQLGMLGDVHATLGITNSMAHALIELEQNQTLNINDLARVLCLEKSTVSRLVDGLNVRQCIKITSDALDGRRKLLSLTSAGKKLVVEIHQQSNSRVMQALQQLTPSEQRAVAHGLELYARALSQSTIQK